MHYQIKEKVLRGECLSKEDILSLLNEKLEDLIEAADEIRKFFCGNKFDLCCIINAKSGRCYENCKYCAQSIHYPTQILEYPLLDEEEIVKHALYNYEHGVNRFSLVTSGRCLTKDEFERVCNVCARIREKCDIQLCASLGLLSYQEFLRLKEAGVTRYHNNLETSRRFFPFICTTHTYDDKICTIQAAVKAGLDVCSGGIIGLGETMEDRIDMALELRRLGIFSVPVNVLVPIPGTPLESLPILDVDTVCRTLALFRFILPKAAIRMAGGRGKMLDKGRLAFKSGANAAITGGMLTTSGIDVEEDKRILAALGYVSQNKSIE